MTLRGKMRGRYDEEAAALLDKHGPEGARIVLVVVLGGPGTNGVSMATSDNIYLEARASLPSVLEDLAKEIRKENSGRDEKASTN